MSRVQAPVLMKLTQMFQVDGEGLVFDDKVTMDVAPEAIEIIVDFDALMN